MGTLPQDADGDAPGPGGQLLLEISAKHGLFADTGAGREHDPESDLRPIRRKHPLRRCKSGGPQYPHYYRGNQQQHPGENRRHSECPRGAPEDSSTRARNVPGERSIATPKRDPEHRPFECDRDRVQRDVPDPRRARQCSRIHEKPAERRDERHQAAGVPHRRDRKPPAETPERFVFIGAPATG